MRAGADRVGRRADARPARGPRPLGRERPLDGVRVAMCLHVTAETANLVRALQAGGARSRCAPPTRSRRRTTSPRRSSCTTAPRCSRRGARPERLRRASAALVRRPAVTIDDGADLIAAMHAGRARARGAMLGGTEETTTGCCGCARWPRGRARCPVLAVNEARTERAFNDRYGTGQSTLDGILRATNLLLAGRTIVVLGYGWTGKGVALRAAAPARR